MYFLPNFLTIISSSKVMYHLSVIIKKIKTNRTGETAPNNINNPKRAVKNPKYMGFLEYLNKPSVIRISGSSKV